MWKRNILSRLHLSYPLLTFSLNLGPTRVPTDTEESCIVWWGFNFIPSQATIAACHGDWSHFLCALYLCAGPAPAQPPHNLLRGDKAPSSRKEVGWGPGSQWTQFSIGPTTPAPGIRPSSPRGASAACCVGEKGTTAEDAEAKGGAGGRRAWDYIARRPPRSGMLAAPRASGTSSPVVRAKLIASAASDCILGGKRREGLREAMMVSASTQVSGGSHPLEASWRGVPD